MSIWDRALTIITDVPRDVQTTIRNPAGFPAAVGAGLVEIGLDPIGALTGLTPGVSVTGLLTDLADAVTGTGASGDVATGGFTTGGQQLPATGQITNITGFGGGNGKTATRTIVQTLDLATMTIIAEKIMEGSPKLMNKDVNAMRKVLRISAELRKKTPKQTVHPSKLTELKNRLIDNAMSGAACPPKCVD